MTTSNGTAPLSFLALGRRLYAASVTMKQAARHDAARQLNKRFWLWVERSPGRPIGSSKDT